MQLPAVPRLECLIFMESVCWRGILRNSWTVWNNPLREVWGGSAAPYAIAAGTINSLLAKTAALHENAIDIQQTVNISAWHTSDGTLHLLAANLEEGLRDDAEADRRSTIALPVPWRDHDWSSIWGSCEIAHSAGTVAIDLGQSESVLLKAKEPRAPANRRRAPFAFIHAVAARFVIAGHLCARYRERPRYAITLAPMCWVVLTEMFPNRIRGAAMGIATLSMWVGNFLLTHAFPFMLTNFGAAGTFWVFAAICAVGFAVMKAHLPETKSKTLEQFEHEPLG